MNKLIKRKKDQGFTLIELMIVIAVIGILAVVLVPRVGSIKSTAKSTGVDVNVRTVAANVQARITSWSDTGTSVANIGGELYDTLSTSGNTVTNPVSDATTVFASASAGNKGTSSITSAASNAVQIYTTSELPSTEANMPKGGVVVEIKSPLSGGIKITGHDSNGYVTTSVTITP